MRFPGTRPFSLVPESALRGLCVLISLAGLPGCRFGASSQLDTGGQGSQLFMALAPSADADGTTRLFGASPLALSSLSFCTGAGAGGDCDQPGATVIPATAQTLPSGVLVYTSNNGVALSPGLALGIKAVTSSDGSTLRLALNVGPASSSSITGAPGDLDPNALLALARKSPGGVNALLAALPDAYNKNFALVYDSHSRQQATHDTPRQILFGYDARFILGIGSVQGDPQADEVEFAAFNNATGHYEYGTITYNNGTPQLSNDSTVCQTCHGQVPRPIWGSYPEWPGVYGSDTGSIASADQAGFNAFLAKQPTDPRYSHLKFGVQPGGTSFELLDRLYSYPNTTFNSALGNTVALGAFTRIQQSPNYATLKWLAPAFSPALQCDHYVGTSSTQRVSQLYSKALSADSAFQAKYGGSSTTDLTTMAYRLLGIDPAPELVLYQVSAPGPLPDGYQGQGFWYAGFFYLHDVIAFQSLLALAADDTTIAGYFGSALADGQKALQRITLAGDARGQALKSTSEYDWYGYANVPSQATDRMYGDLATFTANGQKRQEICQYLFSKLPGGN